MVDSIQGPGGKTIIHIKPPTKEKTEKTKDGEFRDTLKGKNVDTLESPSSPRLTNPAERNLQLLHQQQLLRMQRLETIARQIQDGTYKMADPAVLADRLFQIMTDKKTRDRFAKKLLDEEREASAPPGKDGSLSELELKKLIFKIKGFPDEEFSDEELEALLKEIV